jgi:VWFA-related protein
MYDLLTAVTDSLADRRGRKALVWISRDISMAAPNVRRGDRYDAFDSSREDRVREAFERSANAAGVSVYGFDPDMVTWHTNLGSAASSRGPVDRVLNDPFVGSFSAARNDLSRVSRNTGGRPFIRWGNMLKALAQVQRETARFYLVTYAPPDPPEDGRYHEIEVEVLRRGVEVRARDGYFDVSDADRRARAETGRQILAEPSPLVQMVGG